MVPHGPLFLPLWLGILAKLSKFDYKTTAKVKIQIRPHLILSAQQLWAIKIFKSDGNFNLPALLPFGEYNGQMNVFT